MLDPQTRNRLGDVAEAVTTNFNSSDWQVLGLKTGCTDIVQGHGRLLRSLSFNDPDYEGNVIEVLFNIAERDPANVAIIENVVSSRYALGENVSTAHSRSKQIVFTPSVFELTEHGGVHGITDIGAVEDQPTDRTSALHDERGCGHLRYTVVALNCGERPAMGHPATDQVLSAVRARVRQ